MTPDLTLLESEALIAGLNERVDQLEEENILLEEVVGRNSRMVDALLRNGQEGITLTGPDRRIVRVIKGLTGFDAGSLAGVLIDSLAVPEDRQTIVDAYRELMQGHCGRINIVVRVPLPNGNIVLHTATLTDMLDDPDVHGIVWNYSANPVPAPYGDVVVQGRTIGDLIGSESRFKRLADAGIIGIFEGDGSGQILNGNAAFLRMLGYTTEDLDSGLIRWDRMTVPGYEQVNRYFGEQLTACGTAAPAELEYFRKDGSRVPILIGLASLNEESGDRHRAIGFLLDLTQEKKAQEALRKSEEQFRQLAENIREVFWMMDVSATTVLYVSPAYEHIWGQTCASVYANPESWMDSIHPEDRKRAGETFDRQLHGEIVDNEYRIVQPSGAVRWIRDRAFPIRDIAGNIVRLAGVAEDTTDRKVSELRLVHQALYDELTDLPNRNLFRERLGQAVAECHAGNNGAVFFIDLDEFKLVNDTLGHLAGDRLLKEVTKRLRTVCRASDTLARFGGDEFTLVARGFEEPDAARRLGEKLIRCLADPFRIEDRDVFIGASIGISLFPENGTDPNVLKRDANVAMHEAKRGGKNQIRFFTPEFADAALERLEMETRLRKALVQSEFRLQFQPQFSQGSTLPNRFEALIRWCPPSGPPIPPVKFIPLAEQIGLILPIGTWVLHEACRRCAEWQTGNLRGAGVAVNVSALQFACTDFVETVARTLEATGLPPRLLELELTESVFVQDLRTSARKLAKLRNLGVTIALDDFGTGYSSLSYLQNLPIDTLKIDRTFLLQSESRREGAAVMRCVVELAHTLGLRVVGEGVETPAQLDFLSGLGCDEIQGYLLGKPSFDVVGAEAHWHLVSPGAGAVQESMRL
jgi:diguanylate cyclase (GGDEF)-like protein/PAS domain S-box-containing protein